MVLLPGQDPHHGRRAASSTNDEQAWRAAWAYKDYGKSYEAVYEREHPPGYRWLIGSFGTNMRMTEMQAAIGRVILKKLDGWSRRAAATRRASLTASRPAPRCAAAAGAHRP